MKLEDQVCTFEQAEKLFHLGLNLPTMFTWRKVSGNNNQLLKLGEIRTACGTQLAIYPAYTVAELGVLLYKAKLPDAWEITSACDDIYIYCYYSDGGWHVEKTFSEATEAHTRAEALSWLLKNDFVKVQELKL